MSSQPISQRQILFWLSIVEWIWLSNKRRGENYIKYRNSCCSKKIQKASINSNHHMLVTSWGLIQSCHEITYLRSPLKLINQLNPPPLHYILKTWDTHACPEEFHTSHKLGPSISITCISKSIKVKPSSYNGEINKL